MKKINTLVNANLSQLIWLILKNEIDLILNKLFVIKMILLKICALRDLMIIKMYNKSSKIYFKLTKREKWRTSKNDLKHYDANSLGGQLHLFLNKNDFELIPSVENHDVFHLITQIEPTVKGEIALQCLLFGKGKKSAFLFLSIFAGLILMPEHLSYYYNNYKRGQQMDKFYDWSCEHLLKENLKENIIPLIYK